jgi:hypothetical protein
VRRPRKSIDAAAWFAPPSDPITRARFEDPEFNETLSQLYADLAQVQRENDHEAVAYVKRSIREFLAPVSTGPIDQPLLPLLRRRRMKVTK